MEHLTRLHVCRFFRDPIIGWRILVFRRTRSVKRKVLAELIGEAFALGMRAGTSRGGARARQCGRAMGHVGEV